MVALRWPADTDSLTLQVGQGEQERTAREDGQHGVRHADPARHRETQPDGDLCGAFISLQGGS